MRRHAKASSAGSSSGRASSAKLRWALGFALLATALALITASAFATEVHVPAPPTIGEPGSGPGQLDLKERSGVAINQTSGDVYVADTGNHRVSQFKADGTFIRSFAETLSQPTFLAIDNTTGDIYVADSNNKTVSKFGADGTPITSWASSGKLNGSTSTKGPFQEINGIAVGPGDNLYVYVGIPGRIVKFAAGGGFIEEFEIMYGADGLAVDSAGRIYKEIVESGWVSQFSPTGGFVPLIEGVDHGFVHGLAVDSSNDDLYVSDTDHVAHYDSSANPLETSIGAGQISQGAGIAVRQSNHDVFVADANEDHVLRFAVENVEPPAVVIDLPSSPTPPTPHLTGTVDPEGHPATCRFEYVNQGQFEAEGFSGAQSVPCAADPGSGTSPVAVEADLLGIPGGTTYHARLVASNAGGTTLSAEPNPSFENEAVNPPSISIEAVTGANGHEAHFSAQVNPNAPGAAPQDPAYDTHWHFECSQNCSGLKGGTIAGDNSAHPVSETATNLQPNTPYTVTVVAESVGGRVEDSIGFENPAVAPSAVTSYNTPEPKGKVRLVGYVNPFNSEVTECHFEYGPNQSYGQEAPCEGTPGSGPEPVEVVAHLKGLSAGATYHYRLVAGSAPGSTPSADSTFTVAEEPSSTPCPNPKALGAGSLAECRAWEMVSPPDKNGGDIQGSGTTRMAADGSAASFDSLVRFGDSSGAGISAEYMAVRSPSGWSTHGISPSQPATSGTLLFKSVAPHYEGDLSPDLQTGVYFAIQPLNQQDPNVKNVVNLYLRHDLRSPGAGSYQLLSGCPLCAGGEPLDGSQMAKIPRLIAASDDFKHVIFESELNLAAGAEGNGVKLYEWSEGIVSLAGVLPNGEAASESLAGWGIGIEGNQAKNTHFTISTDGSKIFFTDKEGFGAGNVYMRLDGTSTVKLNVSELGAPADTQQPARFWSAATDGSRVFFTSNQALTEDAPADGSKKLYMYDTTKPDSDPHNLTLISSNEVRGVLGASADGSTVYFFATSQLVAGAPALSGNAALYAWHEGRIEFISELTGEDEASLGDAVLFGQSSSRVSPDGEVLFPSTRQVGATGYNHGSCPNQVSGACQEYYTYNPHTRALQCVSCRPSGAPPHTGDSAKILPEATGGASQKTFRQSSYMAVDGSRVFFNSTDAIVPADTNGTLDAYVYDTRTAKVSLLSSGQDPSRSIFAENDAGGSNAMFLTRERLSKWDVDSSYDLYDARIAGGVPEPSPPPPTCVGDACQPVPKALNDPTPSSSSYHGTGSEAHKKKQKHKKRHKKQRKQAQAQKHSHKHKRAIDNERRQGR